MFEILPELLEEGRSHIQNKKYWRDSRLSFVRRTETNGGPHKNSPKSSILRGPFREHSKRGAPLTPLHLSFILSPNTSVKTKRKETNRGRHPKEKEEHAPSFAKTPVVKVNLQERCI